MPMDVEHDRLLARVLISTIQVLKSGRNTNRWTIVSSVHKHVEYVLKNVASCIHEGPCPSYSSKEPAKYALDVNASFAKQNEINVGNSLEIQKRITIIIQGAIGVYMNDKETCKLLVAPPFVIVLIVILAHPEGNSVYGQSMSTMNNNRTAEIKQHAEHTLDNLVISEHIPLTGQLASGDYILLMDFTPFVTSIEGHSHIALKVPCNEDGTPKVTIVIGIVPNLNTLHIGNAINNGTLNGKSLDLSAEGSSCLYHEELPNSISDIGLVNTSNQTLNFNEGGYYSVTVSAHGTAIQHKSATITTTNQTSISPS
jgi:hypothetical protein